MLLRAIKRHRVKLGVVLILLFVSVHLLTKSSYGGAINSVIPSIKPSVDPPEGERFDSGNPKGAASPKVTTSPEDDEDPAEVEYEGLEEGKENSGDIDKPLVDGKKPVKSSAPAPSGKVTAPSGTKDAALLKSIRDYRVFFSSLLSYKIKSPSIKGKYINDQKAPEKFSNTNDFLFSKKLLENVLDIPATTFDELKDSHTRFMDIELNKFVENYQLSTFGNILESDPEWKDYHGSSGYVLVGGGKYSWLSFLVIKQIRATGAKKPIELFISSSKEYEKDFCEKVLPKYNARCNVFDDKLGQELKSEFNIGGYQFKMLALLSSKFENVLYIDSDNFPTKNIDYLFDSELYKEKNMILWPDAWARTTNPKFFDIAGVKVQEKKVRFSAYDKKQAELAGLEGVKPASEYDFSNSNFHDFEGTLPDPTSETGMFLINKTSHFKTLLLCLYYNAFGPHHYYPLLTQGSAGEGDKETFIAAAHVVGEPWFQTLKQFKWVGYVSQADDSFKAKSLGHYDPIQSLKSTGDIDLVFMHLSYPKFYPDWLVNNHELIYTELGDHIRMYSSINDNVGYDFDLRVMQFFTEGYCKEYGSEWMGDVLSYVKETEWSTEKCKEIFLPHLKWLKETTKFKEEPKK